LQLYEIRFSYSSVGVISRSETSQIRVLIIKKLQFTSF